MRSLEFRRVLFRSICGKTDRILSQMTEIGADALEIDYKTNHQMAHDAFKDKVTLDLNAVVGVQTCALPIYLRKNRSHPLSDDRDWRRCFGDRLQDQPPDGA